MVIPAVENLKKVGWGNLFKINKILKILVFSDILLISGYGLVSPIFAVYVTNQIAGGSLLVVGIAESIYLATKSVLQVPIGILIDKTSGEKIDFWLAFVGSLLMAISTFLYIFASTPLHVYLIEFLFGVGSAISFPAWMGIFTRNMEYGKESFVWSLQSTGTELGSALTATLGGLIGEMFGFNTLFVTVGVITLAGTLLLIAIYNSLKLVD